MKLSSQTDAETVALNAAIEWRAHRRRCPSCSDENPGAQLCDLGRQRLRRLGRSLRALGDRMSARGRIAQQL